MTTGPFEAEAQARESPAVQEIRRAFRADPGIGKMAPLNLALLVDACTMAGVELGAFDRRVLAWLSNWDPESSMVIAGLVTRAHEAGRTRPELGARRRQTSWRHHQPLRPCPEIQSVGSDHACRRS